MKKEKSNLLFYGLVLGGLIGAGMVVYFGSRYIHDSKSKKRERKNKFYEGIDDIFETSAADNREADTTIDEKTKKEIIDELFSRPN